MHKSIIVGLLLYWFSEFQYSNSSESIVLSNLDTQCLRCICHAATECDLARTCIQGYCGPFKISHIYWIDAGKVILPGDDIERPTAYEDCMLSFNCSMQIVTNYMSKFGRDCNGDGVTDCRDYMMVHFNGGGHCELDLNRKETGREVLRKYHMCDPNPKYITQ
ncbi:unnamed protein product [Ceutorhynchus assimilis]|uniref:lysozyme n=1 Tax=Ceutorhynchus assimilis TaxID=467358 RepID=A0A9N9MG74_9CUCU|nr:unnamed protein product [Ceutorhynchus assimilis]